MKALAASFLRRESVTELPDYSQGLESFLKIVKGQLDDLLKQGLISDYKVMLIELLNRISIADGSTAQLIIENVIPTDKHEIFINTLQEYLRSLKPYVEKNHAWTAIFIYRIINNYLIWANGENVKNYLDYEKSRVEERNQGFHNTLTVSYELDPDQLNFSLVSKYRRSDLLKTSIELSKSQDLYENATFALLNLNFQTEFLGETLPLALELLIYIESLNNSNITRQFNSTLLRIKQIVKDIDWSVARSLLFQVNKLLGTEYSQAAD